MEEMIDGRYKNSVRLGEGVADNLKQNANQELSDIGRMFIGVISKYVKEKIQGVNIDELFSKKNEENLINLWSTQLSEKGLIPSGYSGLPDNLLIDNLHQTVYLDGMYVGYVLAMMSMADNDAKKNLILSVCDDIRPNLMGHHYNDRNEFIECFKSEKYSYIDRLNKATNHSGCFFLCNRRKITHHQRGFKIIIKIIFFISFRTTLTKTIKLIIF